MYFLSLYRQEHVTASPTLLWLNCSGVTDDDEISQGSYHWWIIWQTGARPEYRGKSRIREACKIKHSMFHHVRWLLSFCKNIVRLTPLFSSTELFRTHCVNVRKVHCPPSEVVLQPLWYHNHCASRYFNYLHLKEKVPKIYICRLKHSGMTIMKLLK